MNSFWTTDIATHVKIVMVAAACSIAVVLVGLNARVSDPKIEHSHVDDVLIEPGKQPEPGGPSTAHSF